MTSYKLQVCCDYTLPDETHALLWCSCKVLEVKKGWLYLEWEANPAMGEPEATEEWTKLTKGKYKKTVDGGWRYDLDYPIVPAPAAELAARRRRRRRHSASSCYFSAKRTATRPPGRRG